MKTNRPKCVICGKKATMDNPNHLCKNHWNKWFNEYLKVPRAIYDANGNCACEQCV